MTSNRVASVLLSPTEGREALTRCQALVTENTLEYEDQPRRDLLSYIRQHPLNNALLAAVPARRGPRVG